MLNRKDFLLGACSVISAGLLSACAGDKESLEDLARDVKAADEGDLYEAEFGKYKYTFPSDNLIMDDVCRMFIDGEARTPEEADDSFSRNVMLAAGPVYLRDDDADYERLYHSSIEGINTSNAIELAEAPFTQRFANDLFGFDENTSNRRVEVDSTEVVNINGFDMEHVVGAFASDENSAPFVAYAYLEDRKIWICMATDLKAAGDFGNMMFNDAHEYANVEDLEFWANYMANTFAEV